jgi:hypothetical protein
MAKKRKNFNLYVDSLKDSFETFKLLLSKNSQTIIFNGQKLFFAQKKINPKIFHIVKKIKSETLDGFLSKNKLFNDRESRAGIRYYHYNNVPEKLDRFYYIDISSCYISILKNHGIISSKLFDEINQLEKSDRLISLGMCAYEPYEINFIEGVQGVPERVYNIYSPIFYYACNETMKLMDKIIELLEGNFLFYWVDGIFFKDIKYYYLISDFLKSNNYQFSFGACSNFKSFKKKSHYYCYFLQSQIKKNNGEIVHKYNWKEYSIPYYFEDMKERRENYNLIIRGEFDKLVENYKEQLKNRNSND